jgi:hypothetical protein
MKRKKNVMLNLSKYLARAIRVVTLAARQRCFDKLSMTFFLNYK